MYRVGCTARVDAAAAFTAVRRVAAADILSRQTDTTGETADR